MQAARLALGTQVLLLLHRHSCTVGDCELSKHLPIGRRGRHCCSCVARHVRPLALILSAPPLVSITPHADRRDAPHRINPSEFATMVRLSFAQGFRIARHSNPTAVAERSRHFSGFVVELEIAHCDAIAAQRCPEHFKRGFRGSRDITGELGLNLSRAASPAYGEDVSQLINPSTFLTECVSHLALIAGEHGDGHSAALAERSDDLSRHLIEYHVPHCDAEFAQDRMVFGERLVHGTREVYGRPRHLSWQGSVHGCDFQLHGLTLIGRDRLIGFRFERSNAYLILVISPRRWRCVSPTSALSPGPSINPRWLFVLSRHHEICSIGGGRIETRAEAPLGGLSHNLMGIPFIFGLKKDHELLHNFATILWSRSR